MKKNMKKVMALALAASMTLGMTTAALADTTAVNTSDGATGSITVQKPVSGSTYTAYKIFDVEYYGSAYAYTIEGDSEWYSTVAGYASAAGSGLTLTATADTTDNTYIVETTSAFSAPAFAAALNDAKDDKTGTPLETSGEVLMATGLGLGYYFIDSTTGTLCNLTTTDPTAVIYDKNDIPFEKTADDVSVEVGQVINYDIKGEVPNTTGFTSYTYTITDSMSAGLTFGKDVTVKVNGETLESDHYTLTQTDTGFTLDIEVMEIQDDVAEEILVEYTATVNEAAIVKVDENNAKLVYSNDPTASTTDDKEDTVKTYSAKIVIDKYAAKADETDKSQKLSGAEFVLYKVEGSDKLYYYYDATEKKVQWKKLTDAELTAALASDENTSVTVKTTDATGAADFAGIQDGTYYLLETEAPTGYNLLKTPVEVTVDGDDAIAEDATQDTINAALTDKAEVANSTGAELPETGGMGTTIFYILGSIMALGAGILLVAKKRMGLGE